MVDHSNDSVEQTFQALAHPVRLAIVTQLAERGATVLEIAGRFDNISLNGVSKHLKVLERAGLIRRDIQGRTHHCYLETERLREAGAWIDYYRSFWEQRMGALECYLLENREER
jgi:DNA-binding transcriptional ArsR family regulator